MIGEEANPVTWNQLLGVSGTVFMLFSAGVGYVLRSVSQLNKRIEVNTQKIAAHEVKVAEEYATTDAVVQIEGRLTDSINRMSDQLTQSISHLTSRFEAMFAEVLTIARERKKDE